MFFALKNVVKCFFKKDKIPRFAQNGIPYHCHLGCEYYSKKHGGRMKLPLVSLLLLFALALGIFVFPQKSFSDTENRSLQTWQTPSVRSLTNGEFFARLRDFYTDQLPLRTLWIRGKATVERALGKQENNGILFGKNGYLIPKNEYSDLSVAEKNLSAIAVFGAKTELPVTTLLVPRSIDVMTEQLPSLYDDTHAQEILSLMEKNADFSIFPLEELKNASESGTQVWFKTDHHWTADGAYLAYRSLSDALNYTPYPPSYFEKETVSDCFLGTSYSKAGGVASEADSIVLYRFEGDSQRILENPQTGETQNGFYDLSALDKKDHYQVFLGGNTARLTLRDPNDTKPRLLLIKDSFANALVPFLALHFDIDLIDPRYYQGSINAEMLSETYDHILIEQGLDTLATDPSLWRSLS